MSLVDAARRLADSAEYALLINGPGSDNDICRICVTKNTHDPVCPVPLLPQIVAALEAAEATVDRCGNDDCAACAPLRVALRGEP